MSNKTLKDFEDIPLSDLKGYIELEEEDAKHYGIKGMKWGVRRSRAELDRLAGRSHRQAQKKRNREIKKSRSSDSRKRRTISNDDLLSKIERLKLEKELKSLTDNDIRPGRQMIYKAIRDGSIDALKPIVRNTVMWGVKIGLTNVSKKYFDSQNLRLLAEYMPKPKK